MADFSQALTFLLRDEDSTLSGKTTQEPNGGLARFGINSKANPEAVEDGFYTMPREQALEYASILYRHRYFEPAGCFQISDQDVANLYFDLVVNQGIEEATKVAQRACNSSVFGGTLTLQVDGAPGQKTIDAINMGAPVQLLDSIRLYASQFYTDLARAHPDKYPPNILKSWLARLNH